MNGANILNGLSQWSRFACNIFRLDIYCQSPYCVCYWLQNVELMEILHFFRLEYTVYIQKMSNIDYVFRLLFSAFPWKKKYFQ